MSARACGVPEDRLRVLRDQPLRADGAYVLYWMVAQRRTRRNFALDRAVALARELRRPLLVFEPLRAGYAFASDRLHAFLLRGMIDNRRSCADAGVVYLPYVEPAGGDGRGLLAALAEEACAVVSDDHPGFFYPQLLAAATRQLDTRLETVDGNGLLPLADSPRTFARAYDFRRHLQRSLLPHLERLPREDSLAGLRELGLAPVPARVLEQWPCPTPEELLEPGGFAGLSIDHSVAPVAGIPGGPEAGRAALRRFLDGPLDVYAEQRNHPDADGASGLSPYLHFGHLSCHQVFLGVAQARGWTPDLAGLAGGAASGKREGWWGLDPSAEAYLDQLVTWRELGFNRAHREGGGDSSPFSSLPDWSRATLERHAGDPRPYRYTPEQFAAAETHDALWNAAQRQLLRDGTIHNYLRMLWGKKILEWSPSPEAALEVMFTLNDRFALDGRDPNSVSGITWCLGRYDRAWGPERPVFGTVRFMSSANTARKLHLRGYLERYAPH